MSKDAKQPSLAACRKLIKDLHKIQILADGGTPLISNQGQALDGYAERANYVDVLCRFIFVHFGFFSDYMKDKETKMNVEMRENLESVIGKITDELEVLRDWDNPFINVTRCIRFLSEIRMVLNGIAHGLDAAAEREEPDRYETLGTEE